MSTSDIAIRASALGKMYYIARARRRPDTLREVLADAVQAPFRRARRLARGHAIGASGQDEPIWALRDVSFEIEWGEVAGIVGPNGAGKTTLLRILSRITEPTSGFAEIHGRVGSLLEVGTGFHPELSGRENVFLNGAILGMRNAEIGRKFDDIVQFAELEKFIDTPLKHYSSGMRLRLGFAIAAFLDTEILLLDEVLAVGDAAFQRKCLGKIDEVSGQGRAVLFVSHNMAAITRFCPRALWLEGGRVREDGSSRDVVGAYLSEGLDGSAAWRPPAEQSEESIRLRYAYVANAEDRKSSFVDYDSAFRVVVGYEITRRVRALSILCRIVDSRGTIVLTSCDSDATEWHDRSRDPGRYRSICPVPSKLLRPGRYSINVGFFGRIPDHRKVIHENALSLDVSDIGYRLGLQRRGVVTPSIAWQVGADEGTDDAVQLLPEAENPEAGESMALIPARSNQGGN